MSHRTAPTKWRPASRSGGARRLALCGLLASVLAGVSQAAPAAEPLDLVIEAENAVIVRAGRKTPDPAQPGAVIFDGDIVQSAGGRLKVAHCGASILLEFSAASSTLFSKNAWETRGGGSPRGSRLAECTVPDLDPAYQAGDLEGSAAGPDAPRGGEPPATLDLVGQVTRAAALERQKQVGPALSAYRLIRQTWPAAVWTAQPIHRLLLASIPGASGPENGCPAGTPHNSKFAFLIGISHYQRQDWVQDLDYADQDALLFQQFLMSDRGGNLVPGRNLVTLLNEAATQDNIRRELSRFVSCKGSGDNTLIIFIAAHGRYVCVDKGEKSSIRGSCKPGDAAEAPYILTFDSSPEEPKTLGFSMDEFRKTVIDNAQKFGRLLVYVDVCHAGNIGRLELPTTSAVQEQMSGNGTGLLMATTVRSPKERDAEYAYESAGFGHGVFTYMVVRELNGADPALLPRDDGYVHFQDLVSRVQSEVPPVTNYRQFPMPAAPVPQELAVVEDPRKAGIVPWPEPAQSGAVLFRRRGVPPPPGANQPPPRYQSRQARP